MSDAAVWRYQSRNENASGSTLKIRMKIYYLNVKKEKYDIVSVELRAVKTQGACMLPSMIIALTTACAVWVYWDATQKNIGYNPKQSGLLNNAAGLWASLTLLFFVLGLPLYIYLRHRLIKNAQYYPIHTSGRTVKLIIIVVIGCWSVYLSLPGYWSQ